MSSPAGPFKTAQESALRGSTALAAAMDTGGKGILDAVPANQEPPYVVLGQDQILLENGEGCADEAEVFSTVQWWSRPATPDKQAQARAMGAAIGAALNAALTIAGWDTVLWELLSETYGTDPDQSTHGRAEFRYLLTEQS